MFAWFKYCFSHYFTLSGRASRGQFWSFFFVNLFIQILFPVIGAVAGTLLSDSRSQAEQLANFAPDFSVYALFMVAGFLYFCATFLPMIAVTVRRMHDRGLSGWWVAGAILLLPIGILLLFRDLTSFMLSFGTVGGISSIVLGIDTLLGLFILICMLLPSLPGANQYGIRAPASPTDVVPNLYETQAAQLQSLNPQSLYGVPPVAPQPVSNQAPNVPTPSVSTPSPQNPTPETSQTQVSDQSSQTGHQSLLDEMRSLQGETPAPQENREVRSDNSQATGPSTQGSSLIDSLKNKANKSN